MKHLICLLLLLPAMASAQKLTIKKGKILEGDKEIGLLDDKVRNHYKFSKTDGTEVFTAQYKDAMNDKEVAYQWLTVMAPDGRKAEVPYEVLVTSFNSSRIVLTLLSQKYGLIDGSGFNADKIDAFFAQNTEDLTAKYTQSVLDAKETAKLDKAAFDQKVGRYRPYVKSDGTVVFGGQMGKDIVGRLHGIQNYRYKAQNSPIRVVDLDGITVASAQVMDNVENTVDVTLFNGDKFTYKAKRRYSPVENNLFHLHLVEELVARDYVLGRQAKTYNKQIHNEKVALAKARSVNLYNAPGYAIDAKGNKISGTLTCAFEKLDINQTGDNQVFDQIDNYGKKVNVRHKNEKGRDRTVTLNASDNVSFCAQNKEGVQECYVGMKVKGDSMKKLSNAMSLGFNNAYFYKVVFEQDGHQLLVDPVETDRYVVKIKGQKEGQMIDRRSNEKLNAALADYLSDCKEVSAEIRKNAFDLKIEENLVNIVKEYAACK